MKSGQRHNGHRRDKSRVDLRNQTIRLSSETYEWDDRGYLRSTKWYRFSRHWVLRDGERIPLVAQKERDEIDDYGNGIDWEDIKYRVKDHHLTRKLDRLLKRAENKKARHALEAKKAEKKRMKQVQKDVLALEKLRNPSPDPEAEVEHEDPKQKSGSNNRGEIQWNKHGVRLYSNDEKHFFNLGVYKSRKEVDSSTICLFVAGRAYTYTLNKRKMEALFREVTRTISQKDLRRLVGKE